jgi:DNA-binding CsgD family transcriptional regulator
MAGTRDRDVDRVGKDRRPAVTVSATALLTALALAHEHGGARLALRMARLESDDLDRLGLLPQDFGPLFAHLTGLEALDEAVALGFLAGRAADRPRHPRSLDVSSFLMDDDLLVRGAEGRSILELPWFEDDLFVARQLPDITEMPPPVRKLCVQHYRAALRGQRGRFEFSSYGLDYTVDAMPVEGRDGGVAAVLGLARPVRTRRSRSGSGRITARELEVLQLASDGMSGPQIAEHLVLSPGTIKTHFQHIYAKWGVSDRASAVATAMRRGLID